MSFLSHIGLSVIDKATGNALDKLGNAIKKGDVSGLVKQFRGILDGVDDRLDDISNLFEDEIGKRQKLIADAVEDGKRIVNREIGKVKKTARRETKEEIEALHEEFSETLADALMEKLKPRIEAMVEGVLDKRAGKGD